MRKLLAAFLISAALVTTAAAEKRGPSTPEERQRALYIIHELDKEPMSPKLASEREWVFQWLQDVPDVQVYICTGLIGPLLEEPRSDARNAITLQHLLDSAAYEMENPDSKSMVEVYKAGTEGMLRAYEHVLKDQPEFKSPFLESLRAKQSSGQLDQYVREGLDSCRKNAKYMKPPSILNN